MNPSLQERFDEIAAASRAEQQVKAIIDLAKSPKLERSRAARREAWGELLATAQVHLQALDRLAGTAKRAKKRAPADAVPVKAGIVEAGGQAITADKIEAKQ